MKIETCIDSLVSYAMNCGLAEPVDHTVLTNRLLDLLRLDDYTPSDEPQSEDLEEILAGILDYAVEKGLCDDGITARDIFDTRIMGAITPMPREVIGIFRYLYLEDPVAATNWYYKFSCDTDYIRRYRIAKDMRWKYTGDYGELDITINLSKPEKDPKAIAAAKNAPQTAYPKCQLCVENEGYAGRMNHPARANHRIIPIEVCGQDWCLQYSPYVYYNEHCIVFNSKHIPMKIDKSAFEKLLDFVTAFPHYFVGSNADLPIVGGSILSHEHFQGGHYTFAMETAPVEKEVVFKGFEDVQAGIVKWPMSVIRLTGSDKAGSPIWLTRFLAFGGVIPMRMPALWPSLTASLTTPLPPSPAAGARTTSWIWCCGATLPPGSILWVCSIPMLTSTISRRKTSV